MCSTSSLVNKIVGFHDHQTKHSIDYKSNYKKVGVLPIRIVQSNVSSVGPSSEKKGERNENKIERTKEQCVTYHLLYFLFTCFYKLYTLVEFDSIYIFIV